MPVFDAIALNESPAWTVYVLTATFFFAAFFFAALLFVFEVDVDDVDVSVVAVPELFELLEPELLMITTNANTTAISARGARKRAGLFLVRCCLMAH